MAAISQDDKPFIQSHPLAATLDPLRSPFQLRDKEASSTSSDETTDLSATRDAISSLLVTLQAHPVAKRLKSSSRRPLNSALAALYIQVQSDDSDLSPFESLTTAVASNASDLEVWTAVLQLINSISRVTPPPSRSIPPSFNGTPFTRSSASHQGSDQSRADLQQPLRRELAETTFQDVTGFKEKYFNQKKEWYDKTSEIYSKICAVNDERPLKGFPDMHSENEIWTWLDDLQNKHLDVSPRKYFRTTKKGQTTTEAERQLDLFIKPRNTPEAEKHDMRDVLVVGELTSSPKTQRWLAKFIQLATYIRDVFASQPTRRFVHAFLLFNTEMQLWVFDRSGAYSSDTFDIKLDSERFLRVMTGYTLMSDEELGLDTFIRRDGQSAAITIIDAVTKQERQLLLESSPFVRQRSIVSRATTCHRTTDGENVVKFSWRSPERRAESEHLRAAQATRGVAQLQASCDITNIKELRSGLTINRNMQKSIPLSNHAKTGSAQRSFTSHSTQKLGSLQISGPKRSNTDGDGDESARKRSRQSSLRSEIEADGVTNSQLQIQDPPPLFRNRILTCLAVEPAGRPLRDFRSIKEFLAGMRDAIKAHKALFMEGKILHRDISENNIILTDPDKNDDLSGMLIDLDLAVKVGDDGRNEQTGDRHMTGTLEFMALEILECGFSKTTAGIDRKKNSIDHTYRHDLESFFYVFLTVCIRYGWGHKKHLLVDPLRTWYTGEPEDIFSTKRGHMEAGGFELIILGKFSPVFQCLTELARKLRRTLFSKGALFTGTPEDPEELYGPLVEAFDEAIQALKW